MPGGSTLTGLFARQVALSPERTAVAWPTAADESARLSYAELDARSSRLARALRELDLGANVPVAVCLLRPADVLTAVYAVLKADGAYVPIEADNPPERIAGLISDSGPLPAHPAVTRRGTGGHPGRLRAPR
ncbi:AMP-binding protein [Streptomyces sp. 09ZI22]|nr:AMP-binding protein [Streptomyces sp. 09ZI22]